MDSARPPERRYTFMVVPDGGRGTVRQLSVTVAELRRWGMIAAGVSALALVALLFLVTTLPRGLAYRALFDENVALKAQLQDIERRLEEVDDALRRLRLYDAQLEGLEGGLSSEALSLPVDAEASEEPWPEEGEDVPVEEDAPPIDEEDAPPAGPSLGFEGAHGAHDGDDLHALDEDGGMLLPETLSPTLQWALAVADRVRRTSLVVSAALPRAGMLAENAEAWLSARDAFPSRWPVEGVLTSRFGYRRWPLNKRRWQFHSGIDIGAPKGTLVVAPGGGTVARVAYDRGKGNYVEIDHGHGVVSRLNHNSAIFVSEGDLVRRGQAIAAVGSTGMSTGPHCHYAILVNGDYVDPLLYLPARSPS